MKKTSTRTARNESKAGNPARRKSVKLPQEAPWQSLFTKRLPHRVGEPLSSGGSGDGSAIVE